MKMACFQGLEFCRAEGLKIVVGRVQRVYRGSTLIQNLIWGPPYWGI